ncbi:MULTISPECIES: hypothetical protein [Niastella]|uniref:Uncharacterized protein n=1 Tax=Niastella soli TaxID=2821487 RepID=A0ABS3YTI8_9BACT|nr:hypothetical protein [Niastella soli]MBO9201203.1 hypothetical protein [Niastella soli]
METIKITIESNSKAAEFIKKYMAEKKAFKEATAGLTYDEVIDYCKRNNIKFDSPIDPSEL